MDVVPKDNKFYVFLSGAFLQACAYFAAKYYKNRNVRNVDEGFEDVSRVSLCKIAQNLIYYKYAPRVHGLFTMFTFCRRQFSLLN